MMWNLKKNFVKSEKYNLDVLHTWYDDQSYWVQKSYCLFEDQMLFNWTVFSVWKLCKQKENVVNSYNLK